MLYIHLPFCKKRCSYCNFTTCKINKNSSIVALYIDNLCKKIKQYKKQNVLSSIKTIYIGGGTPSYIENSYLKKLLSTIEQSVCISNIEEFSIEGNPDSIDRKFLSLCKNYGVNRLSIGVQSLDDSVLAILGRVHTSSIALNSISLAFEYFKNGGNCAGALHYAGFFQFKNQNICRQSLDFMHLPLCALCFGGVLRYATQMGKNAHHHCHPKSHGANARGGA